MKYFIAKKRFYIEKLKYDPDATEKSDFLQMISRQRNARKNSSFYQEATPAD